jgi:integrase
MEALPWKEGPALFARLDPNNRAHAPIAFAMLTATRRTEVMQARWSEFDQEARVWTLPLDRTKLRRRLEDGKAPKIHMVPLSEEALKWLGPKGEPDALVFATPSGRRKGDSFTSYMTDPKRLFGVNSVLHGFRSCFTDWVLETCPKDQQTHYKALAEKALSHGLPRQTKTTASYRRTVYFDQCIRLDAAVGRLFESLKARTAFPQR